MVYTKVTNVVIAANTIIADLIANGALETRHYTANSVTRDKLAANVIFYETNVNSLVTNVNAMLANVRNIQNNISNLSSNTLPRAGGTMTGVLTLSGDPTTALHATTKSYLDNKAAVFNANSAFVMIPFHNVYTSSGGGNIFFLLNSNSAVDKNNVYVYQNSAYAARTNWNYNVGNQSVQFTGAVGSASRIDLVHWAR